MSLNILFLGSDDISSFIFYNLYLNKNFKIKAIITRKDKKKSRGKKILPTQLKESVIKINKKYNDNIKIYETDKFIKQDPIIENIKKLKIDIIISASFGLYIPLKLIKLAKLCSINVHPSYLPFYRGPSPIRSVLLNNEKYTGSSIIYIDKKLDSGNILYQEKLKINSDDNYITLKEKLKILSFKILNKTLNTILIKNFSPKGIKQDENLATYSKLLTKEDTKIDIKNESCDKILGKIKAFYPKPGAFIKLKNKKLIILKAEKLNKLSDKKYMLYSYKKQLYLGCKDKVLLIKKVKLEGKKEISSIDFINGYKIKEIKIL